ncbi:HAD family hydrolase [Corynebacterium terpenotabidum]|uniref:Phosphoserine phosphatase n=1 Tax=Corynebacterium terpenotabidum Y-11 TaxID=1200352 RepID=S4XIZ7_9CORY|nr:HAD-IB family hydrolase [Corynebacterium terpenotabidum]AGP31730.1 hypothetical protein A606_10455 [Corynebacterium terpenotabidum Y-11]
MTPVQPDSDSAADITGSDQPVDMPVEQRVLPEVPTDPGVDPSRVLAVFDLDKTVIDTSASMAYRKPLADRGLISTGEMIRLLIMLGNYKLAGHDEETLDATRDTLVEMVRGRRVADLGDVAHEALHEVIVPFIYAEARDLIAAHHAAGHKVAMITASARILVTPIAEELGVDHLIATELAVGEDGTFTGDVLFFCKGAGKVEGLQTLAADHGYDLPASYAYSDSATDLPLLDAVGHPVPVNPDKALRKESVARGWETLTFERPEPLFRLQDKGATIARASAGIAFFAALATGLLVRYRGK